MTMMRAFARIDKENMKVELIKATVPNISDTEVLVSMEAFGVGIHDRYFIRENPEFPYIIGIEGVGRITAKGAGVTGFSVGERVAFTSSMQPKGGTWAEYAAVAQASLWSVPDHLSSTQAATVPVAGGTALQGFKNLDIQSGDTLFIAGASGAIGTFAIQLAVNMGIRVAGSASARNLDYMTSLGAELAVDYNAPDWQRDVRDWAVDGVDAALAIQPGTGDAALKVVRDGGKVVTVSGYNEQLVPERNIVVTQLNHSHEIRQDVEGLFSSIADGLIRSEIESEYSFDNALDALEKTETRHARGKLVVRVNE